jgi:hypothetical protein
MSEIDLCFRRGVLCPKKLGNGHDTEAEIMFMFGETEATFGTLGLKMKLTFIVTYFPINATNILINQLF